jgi:hypothetical protein
MLFNRNHGIIMVNVRLSPLIGKHITLEAGYLIVNRLCDKYLLDKISII